ncbi:MULTISPECIES: Rv2231c family pyridoxal phosphate-dependent protein CobC [unclassified Streptomyces]|nr:MULTISPECIES: Rv2231c family pyridoxal phosphate-dependent protein CobC [unclassified Streptomyces]MYY81493.1 threonine-phosphate decarboxylase [Streptomyces sp. SID335]MYZ19104.1 threonine-phosphate decarboxylase [Streptomyces sp. SID337]NEB48604.1 threonine-phosphate decarboxylase [Streptomyces sp. SID339]
MEDVVLVVGVGACEDAPVEEVLGLVRDAVREAGLAESAVAELATVDVKGAEPGIVGAAARLGVPVVTYTAAELSDVTVPNPTARSRAAVGTPSVAEAAALRGGGELLVPKRKSAPAGRPAMATCAVVARARGSAAGGSAASFDLRHHGDAEVRDDGADLTDLAVNVRSDTPPAWLKELIAASLDDLAAYPDGREAREAVAARHGLTPDRVLLTSGAAEAFVLLARALKVRHPYVVHPQFTEPEAALRDAGHEVGRVLLRGEDGFRLDAAMVPEEADLVVVGNPTNPTSVLHPAASIAQLARPGRTLVVDEAFMDAVPGEREALAGRTDVPGLVVLRSLTKTWGLAGLRIGYVLASPDTIEALAQAQPLWPVSTPALVAARACVGPRAVAEAGHAAHRVASDRAHLLAGLAELGPFGVRVVEPAEGPFVLVRVPGAGVVRERLRGRGFAVRRGDTFPGLGPDWIRLAVRDRLTSAAFLEAFVAALGGAD